MRRRRLAFAVCAALCCVGAPAEAKKAQPPPTQATASQTISPALFVARDQDSTLYLFGTIHIRRPGGAWGGANAQIALAEADEVWTEMEITADTNVRAAQLMFERGMAPPGRPLSSWLSEEENARFTALTERLGVPRARFETMQPWLAALMLAVVPMLQAGYDPQAGVDRAVVGAVEGVHFRAFETAEEQVGFFANLSETVQRQLLLDAISDANEGEDLMDAMSLAWERGDLDMLEQLVIDGLRTEYPELFAVMFTQRNQAWVDVLMVELDGAGVDFVAVGAGHLLGEDGLVESLRARGIAVERVPN